MLPRLQYVRLPVVGHDLKHRKIRVNTVSPGSINTPFLNPVLSKHQNEQFLNNVLKSTPLGRMGSPDEVAKVVLFLAYSLLKDLILINSRHFYFIFICCCFSYFNENAKIIPIPVINAAAK